MSDRSHKIGSYVIMFLAFFGIPALLIRALYFVDPDPSVETYYASIFMIVALAALGIYATVTVHLKDDLPDRGISLVIGVLSASISLILGYAIIYRNVGLKLPDPDVIATSPSDGLYFSIVTWTTLGYGDIIPLAKSRMAAASEAYLGSLFMALQTASLFRMLGFRRSAAPPAHNLTATAGHELPGSQQPVPQSAPPRVDT